MKNIQFNGFLSLYADDTSITVAADSVSDLVSIMNQNLILFSKWCLLNKLTINTKKTKILPYFSSNRDNFLKDHKVYIGKESLEMVNVYTYLGIRVDAHLTMKDHLDHLYRAARSMVFTLANIRKYVDTRTAVLIFKAHILSRVEYGSELCIGANKIYLDRLQKLVNKSLRICLLRSRDSNVFDMHVEVKVLPLKIRRNISLMKLMFSRILDERPNFLSSNRRSRTRGDQFQNLIIPFPKSSSFLKSVAYQGPSRWLALPNHLKNTESAEEFHKEIKEWYLNEFLQSGIV